VVDGGAVDGGGGLVQGGAAQGSVMRLLHALFAGASKACCRDPYSDHPPVTSASAADALRQAVEWNERAGLPIEFVDVLDNVAPDAIGERRLHTDLREPGVREHLG
jgi:hypothetical protein